MQYIAVAGPSGIGKNAIVNELLKDKSFGNFIRAITHTTRKPRPGEKHGEDYYFVSPEQFNKLVNQNAFIEYETVHSNQYGISKKSLDRTEKQGADGIVFILDVKGVRNLKQYKPEAISIFVLPPSMDELEARLRTRSTESPEEIVKRLGAAESEISHHKDFDYKIVNNTLKQAVSDLKAIILYSKSHNY